MSMDRINKHEPYPQECPLCKGEGSAAPIVDDTLGVLTPIPRGLIKNEAECLETMVSYYKNLPPKKYVRVADISGKVNESVPKTKESNHARKIGEYIDQHFGQFLAMMLVVLLVGMFGGIIAVDAVEKQARRWDSWMWAHQMEFVPGLKWNYNQCLGESTDKYANRFCEEPSTLYKKYWVWKHY